MYPAAAAAAYSSISVVFSLLAGSHRCFLSFNLNEIGNVRSNTEHTHTTYKWSAQTISKHMTDTLKSFAKCIFCIMLCIYFMHAWRPKIVFRQMRCFGGIHLYSIIHHNQNHMKRTIFIRRRRFAYAKYINKLMSCMNWWRICVKNMRFEQINEWRRKQTESSSSDSGAGLPHVNL